MCGITGFWTRSAPGNAEAAAALVGRMADSLRHRGPDDGGVWSDPAAGLHLGFRRLAIIDVSAAGAQPMRSATGRYVVCYNGEIYNAPALRAELSPPGGWRGHSDTEIMLAGIEAWGLERTLNRMVGMFAISLWDRETRELTLIRDPLGKKPLYWALFGTTLVFGSELRALRAHPEFRGEIDRDALALYMRHGCYPSPHTAYRGVQQLQPGHRLTLRIDRAPAIEAYWKLSDQVTAGQTHPFTGSDSEAVDALDGVLGEAVRERMVSDVPLGAFLSGGYDSSVVVALMQRASSRPVRTFSIGFHEAGYNEADHAKAVAAHLGTEHTELYVTPGEALAVIPKLPEIYDEPFADASQIPTFLVSRMARKHVTVALSGDGGDEVFAGYNRYVQAQRFASYAGRVPAALRTAAGVGLTGLSPGAWDRLAAVVPEKLRPRQAGDKIHKLAAVAGLDGDAFYHRLVSQWHEVNEILPGAKEPPTAANDPAIGALLPDFVARMQYRDTLSYLPDDILTKVDRASMAASLEARAPLLDVRVLRFAWSLPMAMKLRGRETKWLLRQLLYRHVPQALVDRPKMGFAVPIDVWLRGPLRDWAEQLLSEQRLREGGLFVPAPIRQRWQEHLSGRRNWQYALWPVLMFQAWQETHRRRAP
jgi:asparagine synthase (glutamine-hydrolysing)